MNISQIVIVIRLIISALLECQFTTDRPSKRQFLPLLSVLAVKKKWWNKLPKCCSFYTKRLPMVTCLWADLGKCSFTFHHILWKWYTQYTGGQWTLAPRLPVLETSTFHVTRIVPVFFAYSTFSVPILGQVLQAVQLYSSIPPTSLFQIILFEFCLNTVYQCQCLH